MRFWQYCSTSWQKFHTGYTTKRIQRPKSDVEPSVRRWGPVAFRRFVPQQRAVPHGAPVRRRFGVPSFITKRERNSRFGMHELTDFVDF